MEKVMESHEISKAQKSTNPVSVCHCFNVVILHTITVLCPPPPPSPFYPLETKLIKDSSLSFSASNKVDATRNKAFSCTKFTVTIKPLCHLDSQRSLSLGQ